MKIIPSEKDEQIAYLTWLRYFHKKVFEVTHHSANEGKRTSWFGSLLKRMGLKKGYPDLAIHVANKKYHGLFIEMKRSTRRNHKKDPHQEQWLYNLNQNGYLAVYCYTAEEAINITTEYLANR